METQLRHFYLFKGCWIDIYDELVEMLQPDQYQKFSVWEPKDKTKDHHLIIVYGMPLADSYCYRRDIWKSDENVFNSFYLYNLTRFYIHGYKEILAMPSAINTAV
jgi:hypothetical protein